MLLDRIALTSELTGNELSQSDLDSIAAAYQLHATRALAEEWPQALGLTVQAFSDPTKVPPGYALMTAVGLDQMPDGALGFHYDRHRQPAARIGYDPNDREGVTTTFCHEGDEMLVDPSGNRQVICTVPLPSGGHTRARVLVEVDDACEAFTYPVDGLPMSDFCKRAFYGPHRWHVAALHGDTTSYSYCNALARPLTVARGGYLSYEEVDSGAWFQVTWFDGPEPALRSLGQRAADDHRSHREWIDEQTRELARPHIGTHRKGR